MAPRSHLVLPAIASLLLLGLLVGCVPTSAAEPSTPPSDQPSTSAEPSEPAEPTEPTTTPIDVECDTLVSRDAMYEFNPNFGRLDGWQPGAGSPAAEALELDGVACRWVNQTSSDTIDLSVASLGVDQLEALKNAAFEESTMVPTYGEEAYFSVVDGVGTAIVFDRSYWLVVSSAYFAEPGEASEFVGSALSALP